MFNYCCQLSSLDLLQDCTCKFCLQIGCSYQKSVVNSSSTVSSHCLTNNWRYSKQNFGLHNRNITLELGIDNEFARKVCKSGALNFKPANSSTKVNDHQLQNLFGKTLRVDKASRYTPKVAKRRSWCNGFSHCDLIGTYVVTLNQPKTGMPVESVQFSFGKSVNSTFIL